MFRREHFNLFGPYNVDYHNGDDWDLWLRFGLNGIYGIYIPEILFEYRPKTQEEYQERYGNLQTKNICFGLKG